MTWARLLALALAALCVASAFASPRIGSENAEAVELILKQAARKNDGQPAPVVLWHGMGDSCCAAYSIGAVKELIERKLGVFVHSIATGDGAAKDIMSSYFGDVNDQVAKVCQQLRDMPELQGGYNAVGFSQGGQFLRAVAQRCQHTGPRMLTLVTLGAQHQGVMNIPGCRAANESATTCKLMQQLLSRGAYLPYVRDHVVQAQYFKDPLHLEDYLRSNPFLPDINNERPDKSEQYRANLASLERLVLFRFAQDDTVVPRDSAWFYFYNGTALVPLREQPLYTEDWLGLRELDTSARLLLEEAPGVHMEFTLQWFADEVIDKYLSGDGDGDYRTSSSSSSGSDGGGDAPTATLVASRRLLAAHRPL